VHDRLLDYYEQELTYLRSMGADFAQRFPGAAARLKLDADRCDDPHVERLLEGFAFLAARVHLRLDDDASEIAEALLEATYPQYVRPIPSMALVQLHPDPDRAMPGGHAVPRGSLLYARDANGEQCRFRTCFDTMLWPVEVAAAQWMTPYELRPPLSGGGEAAALRVELRCRGDATFASLAAESVRFHLAAEPGVAGTLYELLCSRCTRVVVRDLDPASRAEVTLPGSAVEPAGFGEDEAMLPLPRRAFHGYRLLQEYFAFPQKFSFVELRGLERVRAAGMGAAVEVIFLVAPFEREERRHLLEAGVGPGTLRLGCTPVVNLFPRNSEGIRITQRVSEYRVPVDRPGTGIYSVEDVVSVSPGERRPLCIAPLHALHARAGTDAPGVYWYARRRPSSRSADPAEVWLHFVDGQARLAHPDVNTATARLLCHDGDAPARMDIDGSGGELSLSGGAPVSRISLLARPTPLVHPPAGGARLWALVSQLTLNYASLADGEAEGLRALLRLHNLGGSPAGAKQVDGIHEVRGTPVHARIGGEGGVAFARGHRVEVVFDEEQFAGGSAYLLAGVLDRFLGMYVSINSFSVLAARTRQRREPLREWPPRAGWKPLL
jgi:type VI secretion system protein ImpG